MKILFTMWLSIGTELVLRLVHRISALKSGNKEAMAHGNVALSGRRIMGASGASPGLMQSLVFSSLLALLIVQ
jgi:hypothetical protein